ncbi:L,D-transpeptidase [Sinomonas mesophila]|uniref:L,D-transpeptidase n=1 Tax=Sinomonas mesophila TaxID=1531955 RepID=UPI001FEB2032|nr:Ig-like domain-containing protein [Sinomonas mesophila]
MAERRRLGRGSKIALAALLVVGVLGGAAGVATAPTWARPAPSSEAGSPLRTEPGLVVPVIKPLELGVTPTDGAQEVNPAISPQVKAVNGTVESVRLVDANGTVVPGETSADGSTWTATGALEFNMSYTYEFTLADGAGRTTTKKQSFHTVTAANEADAAVFPRTGATVGTGQPIQITFSEPVMNKEAVEKAVTVASTSNQPVRWHWYSDRMVRIRPETFWAGNAQVTVSLKLFGVEFGGGMVGNFDAEVSFTTGPSRLAVVDDATKTMKVFIDGAHVRTFPVTLGDPDWLSPTGYAVIMEQQRHSNFNAGSIGLKPGDKGYYPPLTVEHANRLTTSGVYVHQALESAIPYVGVRNVSHGCVGLLPADAAWFFATFKPGDVVQTLNTGAPAVEPLEGWGDWNMDWATYAKR